MAQENPSEIISVDEKLEVKFTNSEIEQMFLSKQSDIYTPEEQNERLTKLLDNALDTDFLDRWDIKIPKEKAYEIIQQNISRLQTKINSLTEEQRQSTEDVIAILWDNELLVQSLIGWVKEFSEKYYNTPIVLRGWMIGDATEGLVKHNERNENALKDV